MSKSLSARETLNQIRESEIRAEKILHDSAKESTKILSEADKQAYYLTEKSLEDAYKESESIHQQSLKDAIVEIDHQKKNAHRGLSRQIRYAKDNSSKVILRIVERIYKEYGNHTRR